MPDGFGILIIVAAAWRLAFFFAKEKGPFDVMLRLREKTTLGGLLDCIYCCSIWTAAIALISWYSILQPVVLVAGISGLALWAHRHTGGDFS